ncbi:MAG: DUF5706 domain-containing protein [Bacilli bacterium]|nr:DUF5706 domain-containing protein [Bacilli bacterium]
MANNKRSDLENLLEGIKNQISTFDQKAGTLIPTIGIIYALLIDIITLFSSDPFVQSESKWKLWAYVFYFAMILFGVVSVTCFVAVIFPRKRQSDNEIHPDYYLDINELDKDDFDLKFSQFEKSEDVLEKQVLANANICSIKHTLLRSGIFALVPYVLSIALLIISIFNVMF